MKRAAKTLRAKSCMIENLSHITISEAEKKVLEKGLNFCPTTTSPDRLKLLDDLYFFCRKLRLKDFFHKSEPLSRSLNNDGQQTSDGEEEHPNEDNDERCEMKTKLRNPYFNPSKEPPSI